MHVPKKYFHDRTVLLLTSVNIFLTLLASVLILLRLDSSRSDGYIVEYRANLGLSAFKTGSATTIISFIIFVGMVLGMHTVLSMKIFNARRHFSIAILGLATLLLCTALLVSNALLELR